MNIKRLMMALLMAAVFAVGPAAAWAAPEDAAPLTALPSLAPVVEKAGPAVVYVSVVKVVKGRQGFRFERGPFGGPEGDFFDQWFNQQMPQGERKVPSQGSGFIIDPAGYIVTNNHVVEDSSEIKVKLDTGEEIPAEIVGQDPKTDLALIKLKKAGTYPYLALGDSDKLKVGDWVVAIGNPFGLDHTVTAGILSARSRSIGFGPYDDYLQTDASINMGNSGGPLLNLSGEVVGINSAIVAGGGGGSVGIGLAIPSNLAKGVVAQLKDKGRVVRGWMGVHITKVTPDLAKSFELGEPRGALISQVDPDGPAAAAKLRHGDIVLTFDGQPVKDYTNLSLIVANTPIGKDVKVGIFRDGKEMTVNLTVAEMKEDPSETGPVAASAAGQLGLTLRAITPEVAARQNLTEREGLYIAGIAADSPAAESGLAVGDVVMEINSKPIKTQADYNQAVSGRKEGDILRFLVKRGGNNLYFTVTVAK